MEKRIEKLAEVLGKTSSWRWLGYNTLLGDSTNNQYAGLKIFIRYILDKRASLIDDREDKGVNFVSTGTNPICSDFIKHLYEKAEQTGDEKEKAQLLWMANRAEAMMQMKDPSLGKMNDGIFLAHAFTFIELGEKANPKVEVTEDSIVGLLESGLQLARKDKPELGKVIDFVEAKAKDLPLPTPTAEGEESGQILKPALGRPSAGTSGGVSGYTTSDTKIEATPKPKQKAEAPGVAVEVAKKEKELGLEEGEEPKKADIGLQGEEEIDEEVTSRTPEATAGGVVIGKKAATGGTTDVEGKIKVPEGSKLKRPVLAAGKGKRKKVSKKRKIQQAKDQARKRERQPIAPTPPAPTQGTAGRRQPVPSGGWKIAKRTGKILAGGGTGAGILGWAVSGTDAAASTFAFIHTLF